MAGLVSRIDRSTRVIVSRSLANNLRWVRVSAFLTIASRVIQKLELAKKIPIVDLDVHQGDGTAAIFQGDPSVFTFSMHCEIDFPSNKQTSDLDVPLREGMEDAEYLKTISEYLPNLSSQVKPDLVLYDAGVDPHISDRLGKLALTNTGIFDRDLYVLDTCVSQDYPVACIIAGGYAEDIPSLVYRLSLLHIDRLIRFTIVIDYKFNFIN
jgi:acetoin utilization deacetylase AcuC-like enzyme